MAAPSMSDSFVGQYRMQERKGTNGERRDGTEGKDSEWQEACVKTDEGPTQTTEACTVIRL